jgi:hypothetical protein
MRLVDVCDASNASHLLLQRFPVRVDDHGQGARAVRGPEGEHDDGNWGTDAQSRRRPVMGVVTIVPQASSSRALESGLPSACTNRQKHWLFWEIPLSLRGRGSRGLLGSLSLCDERR